MVTKLVMSWMLSAEDMMGGVQATNANSPS